MIGAVIVALLGMRVGLDRQFHALRGLLHHRPRRGPLGAGHGNILGAAERIERVEIQIERGLRERDHRVLGIIFAIPRSPASSAVTAMKMRRPLAACAPAPAQARAISMSIAQPVALSTAPL